MLQTEIKRVKLSALTTIGDEFPNLAQEAEEVLGYRRSTTSTSKSELAQALAKLEIEVLDWRDVARYKLEQRVEMDRKILSRSISNDAPPNRWAAQSASWEETLIEKYQEFIPDHVLQKALEIKRALPDVQIFIEHLEESADPFLLVSNGDRWKGTEAYWIEVWNEPGFEQSH